MGGSNAPSAFSALLAARLLSTAARAGVTLGVLVAAGLVAAAARAQDPMADVRIETIEVTPGVHMLIGRGGNIGVSTGADGVFLIDDQFAPLTQRIRDAVASIRAGEIRFVLNTHWHGDHTGGNENLGSAGALLVAHEDVRERMSTSHVSKTLGRVPASPPAALPVVTFNDAVTFHWNGDEIHAFHVEPAHTDGDAIVHFRNANVIHAGDIYFNGRYPYIDLSSGGSLAGVIDAVDRILELSNDRTRIIPGHGALSNRTELAAYRNVLVTARDRVGAAIRAGKTVDQVVESHPLSEFDGAWGSGFVNPEAFLRTVYASLSGR
jgi:glyoxylase-like metal-dependent hydrolase (beta-lactamase superfamily II)